MIFCSNCTRPKQGTLGLSKAQSVDIRMPCFISLAASIVFSGVSRLRHPSWSVGPYRPQALPRGPLAWRGSDENAGVGGSGEEEDDIFRVIRLASKN